MNNNGIIISPTESLGATFNPGVVRFHDQTVALVRTIRRGYKKIPGSVNEFTGDYISYLSLWQGSSPATIKLTNPEAIKPDQPYDIFGVEDPRITKIGDIYYICYTAIAKDLTRANASNGIRIALASTRDFIHFDKHGIIGPDRRSKAGIVFESAGALYLMWKDEAGEEQIMLSSLPFNRESIGNAAVWQKFWSLHAIDTDLLIGRQKNSFEDFGVEPGAPPIEIDQGLLIVYSSISSGYTWSVSLMLLDKRNPGKIIAKSSVPFLKPEKSDKQDLSVDVENVIFPSSAYIDDKSILHIFCGLGDKYCSAYILTMNEVLGLLGLSV